MSTDLLIREFERLSGAHGAIDRLRRFVLDLAVRGRLVPQNPPDGMDDSLPTQTSPLTGPYALPASWLWATVSQVGSARLGKMLDKAKNRGVPHRYLRNVNVRWFDFDLADVKVMPFEDDELEEFALRAGDVLICEGGEPGRAAVWDAREPAIYFQKALHRVRLAGDLTPRFFVYYLRAAADAGRLASHTTGATFQHLTGQALALFPVPVPPTAEQRRIVARVDELMTLLDELETAQKERESLRDALRTASLQRLTISNGDGAADQDDARFFFDRLQRLITKPDHVEAIRQTIFDLAVQGRLVSQDPQDEPASKLLDRVCVGKGSPVLGDANKPVPAGWETTTIGQISSMVTSGSRGWAEYYSADGAKFIRAQNIRFGRLALDDLAHVSLPPKAEGVRTRVDRGDVLIVITGAGVTNPAPLDVDLGEAYVSQHVGLVKLRESQMSRWILVCLMAPAGARGELVARAYGAGKPGLNLDNIRSLSIRIPPLAEQYRIVAKVDELMRLSDELELGLASAQTDRGRLLEVVLREALARDVELATSASV